MPAPSFYNFVELVPVPPYETGVVYINQFGKKTHYFSIWNAAFNNVFIKAIRKDIKVLYTEDDGSGNVKVWLDGGVPAGLSGYTGKVYIRSETLDGTYNMLSDAAGYIIIDAVYTINTAAGWVNILSTNYYLETDINKEQILWTFVPNRVRTFIATRVDKWDTRGECKIYLNPYASRIVKPEEDYNYEAGLAFQTLTVRDENLYCVLRPTFKIINFPREVYEPLENNSFRAAIFGFTCSAMQLLNPHGTNMSPYAVSIPQNKAKWMSDFVRPRLWVKESNVAPGYWENRFPFDMSFLYTELADQLVRREQSFDASGSVMDTYDIDMNPTFKNYYGVNRATASGLFSNPSDIVRWSIRQYVNGAGEATYLPIPASMYPFPLKGIMLGSMPVFLAGTTCTNLIDIITALNSELGTYGTYTASDGGGFLKITFPSGQRVPSYFWLNMKLRAQDSFVSNPASYASVGAGLSWNSIDESEDYAGGGTALFQFSPSPTLFSFTLVAGRKYRIGYVLKTLGAGYQCQVSVGGTSGSLHSITATTQLVEDEIFCGTTSNIVFAFSGAAGQLLSFEVWEFIDEVWNISGASYSSVKALMSETKSVKLTKCDCKNPVYLKWIGPTGGWNYWLFEKNQLVTDNTTSLGEFAANADDLANQQADTKYLGKEAWEEWQVGTPVTDDDEWKGLETLFNSPQVYLLFNPDTWKPIGFKGDGEVPPKWLVVKVLPGKTPLKQTKHSQHFFECILKFPKFNLQWA